MSSLFASLATSANSLAATSRALDITQNNIGNASTPGFAAQTADFEALSFDPAAGASGGVKTLSSSTRNWYADESVRKEVSRQGTVQQLTSSLTGVNSLFDITAQTGIAASLNQLQNSFSALSVTPSDSTARQNVIDSANAAAASFQQLSASVASAATDAETGITANVNQINTLAKQIQSYNIARQQSGADNAGLDANVAAALETLSGLVNISASTAADGTTTVLLGGQTPLVQGAQLFSIQSAYAPDGAVTPPNPGGAPAVQIQDQYGNDITSQVTDGSLAGLLQVRNSIIPSIRGDRSQQGSLNQLAQAFADRVNTLLTSGNISSGPPAVPGVALFTYDTTNATNTAGSLAVNSAISAAQIATIDPGPPASSNGIANSLAQIAAGANPADQINGVGFTAFFGQIASQVGSQLSNASDNSQVAQQLVAQAKTLQTQLSGVSLDNEAVLLLQYQKSYEAVSKLINILDQVTQSALAILP